MNGNNYRERFIRREDQEYVNNNRNENNLVNALENLRKEQYFENNIDDNKSPKNTDFNTLQESVWASLQRDLKKIYIKLKVVVVPYVNEEKVKELKQWDLWGPFVMCLLLGLILSFTSKKDSALVFTTVFVIIWIGSMIITLNTKLLGGHLSLLQCICLLGYCLFPVNVASLLTRVIFRFLPAIIKLVIVSVSFMWSTKASVPFISQNIQQKKKLLAVYPVMLFFLYLNYYVLV